MQSLDQMLLHSVPEWLEFLFLTFCIGSLLCRLWILGETSGIDPHCGIFRRLWLLFALSAAAMSMASGGDLMIRAAEMSGQSVFSVFPLLPTVIRQTHLGQVWLIRETAVLIVIMTLLVAWRHRDSRLLCYFLLWLLLAAAMTKSASGHAADAGDFSLPEWVDWIHFLAASFWAGGILTLSVAILPLLPDLPDSQRVTATVAERFSRIAGFAVCGVAATACYSGYASVGSTDALFETPYGWILVAKICLFLLAIGLGAANRWILIPLLQEHARKSAGKETTPVLTSTASHEFRSTQAKFAASVRSEAIASVVILLCAALLRHNVPARHYVGHTEGSPVGVHEHHR